MTLNPSGPMAIGGSTLGASINLELGRAADAPSNLNEQEFRDLAEKPSGLITLQDFYGKSVIPPIPPPGEIEFPSDTTWAVPPLVTRIGVCMIGGGGGGSGSDQAHGGRAGKIINQIVDVTPGETLTMVVGIGGIGHAEDPEKGGDTTLSGSFGSLFAEGGEHANNDGYRGNGDPTDNCYGRFFDGDANNGSGGQAGFGNGGSGSQESPGKPGGTGAGGGGCIGYWAQGGPGGDGLIKIYWGMLERKTVGTYAWTVPPGVFAVYVCMIGGGSAGEGYGSDGDGGDAGEVIEQTVAVTPGEVINIVVGEGGGDDGGGDSSFGSLIAHGSDNHQYEGNGDPRTTCYGTANDGLTKTWEQALGAGGQAGFGPGGDGAVTVDQQESYKHDGVYGGGGGGAGYLVGVGMGGHGLVKIKWGEGISV